MDWDKLRVFHAVAEAGSLTHAGEILHLSQSAVSRQIRGLEEDIGAPLFHRHPRGLLMTGEGELLFDATRSMMSELNSATARIRDSRDAVKGELRVTTTVGFGTLWLAPRLPRLFELHPDLSIDLRLTERVLDIAMREADVAIRMRSSTQADLIERPLFTAHMRLFASTDYLRKHGAPKTREDLARHSLILYSPEAPQPAAASDWLLPKDRTVRPLLTVNNHYGMLRAVRNSIGIAPLPDYLTAGESDLKTVLSDLEAPEYTVHLVYPTELRKARRVAAFRDFLLSEVAALPDYSAAAR